MYKIDLKALRHSQGLNVENIGWKIANSLRGEFSDLYQTVICTSYVAYLILKNELDSSDEIDDYIKTHIPEDQALFIRNVLNSGWDMAIEISKLFSIDELLAVFLWLPCGTLKQHSYMETPVCLAKLACRLLGTNGNSIADFGCGTGNFLLNAAEYGEADAFYGYEVNTSSKGIASIRMSLISDDAYIHQTSVFSSLEDRLFDRILCDYPWNIKTRDAFIDEEQNERLSAIVPELMKISNADWHYIINVLNHLSPKGRAVIITCNGTTWNGGLSAKIRERLVKGGYIESVISLPNNLYAGASIPVTMIVLNKGENKGIRMIDASEMMITGRRLNDISDSDIERIVNLINTDAENSVFASIERIEKENFAINPSRYLDNEIYIKNGVKFETVIKRITRGAQIRANDLDSLVSVEPTRFQYLMLADIQDGIISDDLPYLKEMDERLEKYCIKNNSLVMSKNGEPVKVAVATVSEGQQILANGNMYVIELDEEKVNPIYVKAFMESELGSVTLSRIMVGSTMPNIPVESLKNILIPLVSMEEQNAIAEKYKAKVDEIKVLRVRLNSAIAELKKIVTED